MKHHTVFIAGILFSLAGTAGAAGTVELQATDDAGKNANMQFQWRDANTAKMRVLDTGAQDVEMLIIEQGSFMVMGDRVMAMDGFASKGQPSVSGESQLLALTGPHGSRQVAGYTGGVYTMRWRDRSGEHSSEAVLSSEAIVREMTRVWMGATARLAGQSQPEQESIANTLQSRGLGILAVDGAFTVTRLDNTAPPASAFELPAGSEVQTLPTAGGGFNIRNLIPGMAQDKAERQTDRQADHVDSRVDEETDSYIDKKVGGMLDKLFGK